jgi:Tfp pilus assembly protein PilV
VRSRRDRGSSLLEVVIACVLLGILSTAVLTIVLQTQSAGENNRNRIAAANLAAREIDMVRADFRRTDDMPLQLAASGTQTNKRPLTGGTAGQPLVVDGTPYTVRTSMQWNVTGNATSACDGGTLVKYPTLGVTVTVTWPNMGGIKPVTTSASLAPEKGDGVVTTTDSFVAVRVKDSSGAPNPGRGVAVTGGSSTVTGTTDAQGCAVVEVTPAAGGTAYTAKITDSGYVDISGTPTPSKAVGTLQAGKLNNSVVFQVDRAGTVNLRLVDDTGTQLDASAAVGAQITLVASESSGASNTRTVTATGPVTSVSGLWPTTYGAFIGTTPPAAGYTTQKLTPGGTVTLDAVLAAARLKLSAMPAGTTAVYAAPDGVTSCTDPEARQVDPNAVTLLPGTWGFFAKGATFACSPGPSSVALASGDNGEIVWGETTIRVDKAPAGTIWAVDSTLVGTTKLTTCPTGAVTASAVNLDGARTGPVAIPAGTWYIYVTSGGAAGPCVGVPAGQYAKVLAYDADNVLVWATSPSTVTATNVRKETNYSVVTWTGAATMTCTNGVPAGVTTLTKASTTGTGTTTASGSLAAGTWQIFVRNSQNKTCTLAGTVTVDGLGTPYNVQLKSVS